MSKDKQARFQTNIKEPRWQQVVSIIVVLCIVGFWVWLIART